MADTPGKGDRSIQVGGNVEGSILQAGDHNTASLQFTKTTVPDASSIDIADELAALRALLSDLQAPDQSKIGRALDDATDEIGKAEPDRDEIGGALERALKHARKAESYTRTVDRIGKHVTNVVGWLGTNWESLLEYVGLTT